MSEQWETRRRRHVAKGLLGLRDLVTLLLALKVRTRNLLEHYTSSYKHTLREQMVRWQQSWQPCSLFSLCYLYPLGIGGFLCVWSEFTCVYIWCVSMCVWEDCNIEWGRRWMWRQRGKHAWVMETKMKRDREESLRGSLWNKWPIPSTGGGWASWTAAQPVDLWQSTEVRLREETQ